MEATSRRLTQPELPAGSVDELITHLRLSTEGEYNEEREYLETLLFTASNVAERYMGRTLIESKWARMFRRRLSVNSLADEDGYGKVFYLPFPPVQSVDQIKIINSYEEQILTADDYYADLVAEPAEVELDIIFMSTTRIYIAYTAGYGDLFSDIPYPIRQGILMFSAFMYNNRGECSGYDALNLSGAKQLYGGYKIGVVD